MGAGLGRPVGDLRRPAEPAMERGDVAGMTYSSRSDALAGSRFNDMGGGVGRRPEARSLSDPTEPDLARSTGRTGGFREVDEMDMLRFDRRAALPRVSTSEEPGLDASASEPNEPWRVLPETMRSC